MEFVVLKPNLEAIDLIDTFKSAIWTDRYSKHGDFEICTPIEDKYLEALQDDNYLLCSDSDYVMIIEDRQISPDIEHGNYLIITGRSLESILDRRIIWKETLLTGNFQNGIKKLLDENAIVPTVTERKISNFVFEASTDPVITALTIDAQFMGENLLDAIEALCEAKNVGFTITLTDDGLFKFKLYSGVNRSYDQTTNPYVVFSPNFENLLNSNYLESKKPLKTVALVGGEGDGAARKTASVEISTGGGSGLSRREMFTDASSISSTVDGTTLTTQQYTAQLTQKGNEELAKNVMLKSFEGKAEIIRTFTYGEDFFMGDIVQIANEYGMESKSRVIELVRSQDDSGEDIWPTFANA